MPDLGDKITLRIDWSVAGVATDDAGTTIVSTAPDGTPTSLTVTHGVTGRYTAPLTFSQLGTYTIAFTAPNLGQAEEVSYEVTSDPRYFGLGELRQWPGLSNTTTFTDQMLSDARDWIEGVVERECGTSFVAKPITELLSGSGYEDLVLTSGWAQTVTACSVNGTALTTPEVALIVVEPGGLAYRRSAAGSVSWVTWPVGRRNISISYLAGYSSAPPADLKEAMLQAARVHVAESRGGSGTPARTTSITNETGNVTFAVAGPGRPTGIPDVDATIMAWAGQTRLFGFA